MSLPDCIEIVPPTSPALARIDVPGSKSITNRALILAALSPEPVTLKAALWSEDTQVMIEALRTLGFEAGVEPEASDPCNRTLRIRGAGGRIPKAGSPDRPIELFVGNAGTAARFLAALVCLGDGCYRLDGVPRMRQRPQGALFQALRALGYTVDAPGDRLPAIIHGKGPIPAACTVSVLESSQFASALILSAAHGGWLVNVESGNSEELPYVEMTRQLVAAFPANGGEFVIEPDASSGSYFWGAGWLLDEARDARRITRGSPLVGVNHWPTSGWQVDARFPEYLSFPSVVSREKDLGDSIMTAIALAPFAPRETRFTDLGRLRVQECERVQALRCELLKCGARVVEDGDTLTVSPGPLHGAVIETYNDHRMAMCLATLGLKVPGIKIKNPACVKKTFPNFFQKLSAPPVGGLGAVVLNGTTGQPLAMGDLLAH